MKPESVHSDLLLAHLRRCRVDPAMGYSVWTIEAEFPMDAAWYKNHGLPQRVGRVHASLFNAGVEVQLDDPSARTFLALLLLTGAPCDSWVTSYCDPPDTEQDPGFEIKDSDGRTQITAPAFAGRLWVLGNLGNEDPDVRIADWSQRDVGSVNYYSSPHGAYKHVI